VPKRKNPEDMSGSTFADLYDAQDQLTQSPHRRLGRPKNKVQRKPTTVYLTKDEERTLRRLQLTFGDYISSVNRSQIIGLAIELLSELVIEHGDESALFNGVRNIDVVKARLKEEMTT